MGFREQVAIVEFLEVQRLFLASLKRCAHRFLGASRVVEQLEVFR